MISLVTLSLFSKNNYPKKAHKVRNNFRIIISKNASFVIIMSDNITDKILYDK